MFDCPVPISAMVNGQYYCALLQGKVRPTVCHEQPELTEHGVILLQHNAEPHCHHDMQNLVQCWDTKRTHCVDRQTESRLNPCFSFTSEEEWGDSEPFHTVHFTLSTADHLFTNRMNSEKRYFI
jgi:hypothetical protein